MGIAKLLSRVFADAVRPPSNVVAVRVDTLQRLDSSVSPPSPSPRWDRELTAAAQTWLVKIPTSARPNHLADEFPRLANRLAFVWGDIDLADRVLDDLLVDRRGGRRGFPPAVSAELLRLQAFHARRLLNSGAEPAQSRGKVWDIQASADR